MILSEKIKIINKYGELLSKYDDTKIKEVLNACPNYVMNPDRDLPAAARWIKYFEDEVAMNAWLEWEKLPCLFLDGKIFAKTPDNYGRVNVIAEYFEKNPELIKDKVVMDFGAGGSALALKLKLLGAKDVIIVDITHYVAIDTAITNILYNANIDIKFQISMRTLPDCDVIIASGIFNEEHVWWKQNWKYIQACELYGKELYVCSQRILKGEHPYIKPDMDKVNILYDKNGISLFNKINHFELIEE